jgi:hypothetical protein
MSFRKWKAIHKKTKRLVGKRRYGRGGKPDSQYKCNNCGVHWYE